MPEPHDPRKLPARKLDRRSLLSTAALSTAAAGPLAASLFGNDSYGAVSSNNPPAETLSLPPKAAVEWPEWDADEQNQLMQVLQSGVWGRSGGGRAVPKFEEAFRQAMRAKHCVATTSGTTALMSVLGALGIGPGDEVIIPPYTFVATFNVITMNYALPVFADVDRESFQLSSVASEQAITGQTRAIMPVHLGGSVGDMDAINKVAALKSVPVVEDACQAPLAEWRGQPVGTIGLAGCISFQSSKNISAGEGGAVLTNDDSFAAACYDFHSPGGLKKAPSGGRGANFRMTEFQAGVLLAQLARAESHARIRERNALRLNQGLGQIPGIYPARLLEGCTRSGWHLYPFRFDSEFFGGRTRADFLKGLAEKGIRASVGYSPLPASNHVQALAKNPYYLRIYGEAGMANWLERIQCPENEKLCSEAVWLSQTTLLQSPEEIERIIESVADIQRNMARG